MLGSRPLAEVETAVRARFGATRVTDAEDLQTLADAWFAKYGDDWKYEVRDQEFNELSHSGDATGRGAWVFRVPPTKVLAFGDAHGQTAYRF